MIPSNTFFYRLSTGRKVLTSLLILSAILLIPTVSAWPSTIHHPDTGRQIPIQTIDPNYLWANLDNPKFQQNNDIEGIREYLEALYVSGFSETGTSPTLLKEFYNPISYKYQPIHTWGPKQIQTLLEDPVYRAKTLENVQIKPQTLKSYYKHKNMPKKVKIEKPVFKNTQLCITWIANGKVIRHSPPGCN